MSLPVPCVGLCQFWGVIDNKEIFSVSGFRRFGEVEGAGNDSFSVYNDDFVMGDFVNWVNVCGDPFVC